MRTLSLNTDRLAALASKILGAPTEVVACLEPGFYGRATQPEKGKFRVAIAPMLLQPKHRSHLHRVFWHEVGHCALRHVRVPGDPDWQKNAAGYALPYERQEADAEEYAAEFIELFNDIHPDTSFFDMFVTVKET